MARPGRAPSSMPSKAKTKQRPLSSAAPAPATGAPLGKPSAPRTGEAAGDRGRRFGKVKQLTAADESAFVLEIPVPYQPAIELGAEPFQGRPVAVDPGPAAEVTGRAGDRRYGGGPGSAGDWSRPGRPPSS